MSGIDWIVLSLTLLGIIAYGLYKSRTSKDLDGYFLSNRSMPWYLVLLSIMGTQASAVTFLSAPGQAYTDGMRFVQYYFGLPLAMVVLCITFVPLFSRLKVYTAYEFLEQRFDVKTRTLTSFLFLLQRGLSTGISIYAPSIILSSLLGWDIFLTNIVMGGLLIIYTVTGGAKAVAYTQQLQFVIIFIGMFLAGYMIIHLLPPEIGFADALRVSGASGKMNVITTGIKDGHFDWNDKYNIWSGIIGGFFLALSYFGTDQSQVGRYLTAKNSTESKLGLLINGVVKVPMQFFILLIGAMLFTFYQFKPSPVFHNGAVERKAQQTAYKDSLAAVQATYVVKNARQGELGMQYLQAFHGKNDVQTNALKDSIQATNIQLDSLRKSYKSYIKKALPLDDNNDTNYIFLRFVIDYLPVGLIGLLIAIIFLAAWGSIAAALNSLASCTMIDFHRRYHNASQDVSDEQSKKEFRLSRYYTFAWGIFCIIVAQFAYKMGSLIEAVNVLGSLFYGVILGIFLVAFYLKQIGGKAVFWSAVISEIIVVALFILNQKGLLDLSFLWLNAVGALLVVAFSLGLQLVVKLGQKN
ncbi:sodium:solute symporter [Segetibacter sp.]|jgi:SSS family transporter|uniref:sodium:solute symporter n=1 Tax=Segetibacter sp. TaxID=2231182 RepID=UPI00260AF6A3|nr:sodium:solute symporter [Segetibacter sp.]MCW3079375.1 sodium:solute symporter [Segetibacter sp.]